MTTTLLRSLLPACGLALFLSHATAAAPPLDSAAVKMLFAQPPREYATAPLWVWNDLLTEDQIRGTLRDLAGQQVRQVFVHPRPGLMTPYLSADWFRLWKVALDEAAKLDMNVWIYDENSYPSGFAGGWVPELMPESRGQGLHLNETKTAPAWEDSLVAVLQVEGDRAENVSAKLQAGESLPEGRYLVARVRHAGNSPWHGNRCYVNLLTPGVTDKFIEVTHEAYKRELGEHFGKRVPGIFTDEPNIRPAGGFPWCADLPEQFQQRWGYNLLDHLAGLVGETGDWRRVRHNYFSTLNALFIERWARPVYNWCAENNLAFTGHYWDHEWPHCSGVPDNMAMAAWQQVPGIDCLMNQYAEHNHAQFGNLRMVRELNSVANQLGRQRRLCEIYGAGGWDLRFEDMKRIADWLGVLGVNLFDEHLSYITLRGARKRDHPQSFSYHEPWWTDYHVIASYLTRLSCALSQGEQFNRILVLEPTTTTWMYQGNEPRLRAVADPFFQLLIALDAAQVEYDLGCEDLIARHGSVQDGKFVVGQRAYHTVIVPPTTETLDRRTWELLEAFRPQGRVELPPTLNRIDGQLNPGALPATPTAPNPLDLQALAQKHQPTLAADAFAIQRNPDDHGILFHQRRQLADGQLLLLVNTSSEAPSAGTFEAAVRGLEEWDLFTGQTKPYPAQLRGESLRAQFALPPSGSLLLFLANHPLPTPPRSPELRFTHLPTAPPAIQRLEPNVLTLDYVSITAGDEARTNIYFYQANQFAWQQNGVDRNPWDSAVQFKEELISKTFPPESGFTATYEFTIEREVPKDLAIVIERADLYTITCNGQPVAPTPGKWWLDKAFHPINLAPVARTGPNTVTLQASPFTLYHELEPAYLLGNFSLKPAQRGFVIIPPEPLRLQLPTQPPQSLHGIHPDGSMWLSGGVGFEGAQDRQPSVTFDLGQTTDLSAIHIWNYNENHVRDLTARGADAVRFTAATAANPDQFTLDLGTFRLTRAPGSGVDPEPLPVTASGVRRVRCEILSNHHGVQYPATGVPPDNGFVGLAEVRFLDAASRPLANVRIAACSSELTSHDRLAKYLLDGSGFGAANELRPGWNRQGHPFYAAGVAYTQNFPVPNRDGTFILRLADWHGSVARITVNGQPAGHILAPPWECDITRQIKPGNNNLEVTVIGTLKNTLGPHHNGPNLGSAWPGMFHRGPNPGPPPGNSYHTVAYGLFAPMELRQTIRP